MEVLACALCMDVFVGGCWLHGGDFQGRGGCGGELQKGVLVAEGWEAEGCVADAALSSPTLVQPSE